MRITPHDRSTGRTAANTTTATWYAAPSHRTAAAATVGAMTTTPVPTLDTAATPVPVPAMPRGGGGDPGRQPLHLLHGPWPVIVLPAPRRVVTPTTW